MALPAVRCAASLTEAPAGCMEKLCLLDNDAAALASSPLAKAAAAPPAPVPPRRLSSGVAALQCPERAVRGIADALAHHGVCVCAAGAGADAIAEVRRAAAAAARKF
jgi:hypothetical protein